MASFRTTTIAAPPRPPRGCIASVHLPAYLLESTEVLRPPPLLLPSAPPHSPPHCFAPAPPHHHLPACWGPNKGALHLPSLLFPAACPAVTTRLPVGVHGGVDGAIGSHKHRAAQVTMTLYKGEGRGVGKCGRNVWLSSHERRPKAHARALDSRRLPSAPPAILASPFSQLPRAPPYCSACADPRCRRRPSTCREEGGGRCQHHFLTPTPVI